MKQVLITGGAGFIGSHLAEALLGRGHRVTVVDDESAGSPDNLHAVRDHFDFNYVKGDVTDPAVLREMLPGVDEVYHLASTVGIRPMADSPADTMEKNLRPTERLLDALSAHSEHGRSAKLFLASGSDVYGMNPKEQWREDDTLMLGPATHGRWCYGVAKAACEFLALAHFRQHQTPVVVGRLFNVVGARQRSETGAVLPSMVEAALAGRPPVVYDDGEQMRALASVEGVCRAILDLMETEKAFGQIINIGSDQPLRMIDVAERVVALINPELDIEFESYRQVYGDDFQDLRHCVADLTKLESLIGFKPQTQLDATIQEVIDGIQR